MSGEETRGGEFPTETPASGGEFRAFLQWRKERRARMRELKRRGEELPQVDPEAGRALKGTEDSVTWAGHASVIHRLDGVTALSDPVWSPRIAFLVRRLTPAAPRWEDVPSPQIVALSHNHYDHLDADTVKRVRKTATMCVPRGDGPWFRRRRFRQVEEFDWWQTKDLAGLKVTFVPTQHFSGRYPWDRNKSLFGGWILEGKRHAVYHAGDSGYFSGFSAIGERFRRLDVACLPIGAYQPRWFMRPYHMSPEEAGQAFLDLQARSFLPIHWGTFRLSDEAMDDPPKEISSFFREQGLETDRLWLPRLGETIPVEGTKNVLEPA